MTIKLHTEKVFLPARPQAMAFLKGKIDSLLSKCKIYISHKGDVDILSLYRILNKHYDKNRAE